MSDQPCELEDDVAEMVDHVAYLVLREENAQVAKNQLRECLVKLIDQRIAAAFEALTTK